MNSQTRLLTEVLRAEAAGLDMQEDVAHSRIVICAMREDGTLYELGSASIAGALQDPEFFRYAINKIKFWRLKFDRGFEMIEGRRDEQAHERAVEVPTMGLADRV